MSTVHPGQAKRQPGERLLRADRQKREDDHPDQDNPDE
jgi:hypothetical protein